VQPQPWAWGTSLGTHIDWGQDGLWTNTAPGLAGPMAGQGRAAGSWRLARLQGCWGRDLHPQRAGIESWAAGRARKAQERSGRGSLACQGPDQSLLSTSVFTDSNRTSHRGY